MIDLTELIKFNRDTKKNFIFNSLYHFQIKVLKRILYINQINSFIQRNSYLDVRNFINELFEELGFSYTISNRDLQKIPSEGRLICVANHPIGSLDSLSLLKAFLEIRPDVKIVANDVLYKFDYLKKVLLPFKLDSIKVQKQNIEAIQKALENDSVVIIFPAGTVSRLNGLTIADSKWSKGAVHFAKKTNSPILPIYINAKNSVLFYFISAINKKLSSVLLAHELFNKRGRTINIKIGNLIPAKAFSNSLIDKDYQTKLLRKHTYLIGRNKKGIYSTVSNVIHPLDRRLLKKELAGANFIGETHDGMKIYLTTKDESPHLLNEISRLRELTFRKIGEGTGKRLDLDKYDTFYKHLIVWDDAELEIVGSYRLGIGTEIMQNYGVEGFYTSTLFNFSQKLKDEYLVHSLELGRSFIQKKYWNTNALNYLWQGIGAYLSYNNSIKYLFGGVSISNNYELSAKEAITFYYGKYYGDDENIAQSKRKFVIGSKKENELKKIFSDLNVKEAYKTLKHILKPMGFSVPILYKHYSDLCEPGGVKFLDFGVDPDFENCIDGLILVEVEKIKEEKKQRFIKVKNFRNLKATA